MRCDTNHTHICYITVYNLLIENICFTSEFNFLATVDTSHSNETTIILFDRTIHSNLLQYQL